ncbi:MAG: glutamate-5-semialdehyde dehydrogenase [Bacteriovoracaceae bacterium]
MKLLAQKAKSANKKMRLLDDKTRNSLLLKLAHTIRLKEKDILLANSKDMKDAGDLSEALRDRLLLNIDRIESMATTIEELAQQKEVIGHIEKEFIRSDGLHIQKVRIPLGVILMIFESRPNVIIDAAALAIKSSNCIILKGGKEAKHSNEILGNIVKEVIKDELPLECIQVLSSTQRGQVDELLSLNQYIDVVIPRGGEELISYVYEKAKMAVIAHYKGLCHLFVDKSARVDHAKEIIINAKVQRPGVSNAIETLLIHKDIVETIGIEILNELEKHKTQIRVDSLFNSLASTNYPLASDVDWETEYLDNVISVKVVGDVDEAIEHIEKYGTLHTEGIISEDSANIKKFILSTDSSCVMINASTRFNDGGQLGLGAELGISTSKIGVYGPMGAEQMTTCRYIVTGQGHIRG